MSSGGPSKKEIDAVFNRLRSQATNKNCFDCGAKNPTWASVTYGIFICIDCSAVHRSLGVHLTFVRSTNLDTNWTWLQLRQMMVGGNANASQFFRQHNCNTTDAQQKYNSRAAQLYRDKLQTAAQNAMKTYGTEIHLDQKVDSGNTKKQSDDFFAEYSKTDSVLTQDKADNSENVVKSIDVPLKQSERTVASDNEPSIDLLNAVITSDTNKSTIGVRKIPPKKSNLGIKKGGLGAVKVKANFADIEKQANLSIQQKSLKCEENFPDAKSMENAPSARLSYQDLSFQKNEETFKNIDPLKAKQLERLGISSQIKGGISHSVISDMQTIAQESAPSTIKTFDQETSNADFDEYSTPMYNPSRTSKALNLSSFETIEPIETVKISSGAFVSTDQASNKSFNLYRGKTASKNKTESKISEDDMAQKKFGNAKGISSDQFFDSTEQMSPDQSTNLARFQGLNSISSSDFFQDSSSTKSTQRGYSNVGFTAPDLDDVKESVRQGVSKVAGRLSSLASDVMSTIQDKYGY